ncbi:hypothetical protein BKA93DRAFT_354504 [Sparassis latifolia]
MSGAGHSSPRGPQHALTPTGVLMEEVCTKGGGQRGKGFCPVGGGRRDMSTSTTDERPPGGPLVASGVAPLLSSALMPIAPQYRWPLLRARSSQPCMIRLDILAVVFGLFRGPLSPAISGSDDWRICRVLGASENARGSFHPLRFGLFLVDKRQTYGWQALERQSRIYMKWKISQVSRRLGELGDRGEWRDSHRRYTGLYETCQPPRRQRHHSEPFNNASSIA